jgi:hypothetical protein
MLLFGDKTATCVAKKLEQLNMGNFQRLLLNYFKVSCG